MKKQRNYYLMLWLLAAAVYNLILFVILPDKVTILGAEYSKFNATFWSSYIAIMAAFAGNLIVSLIFFAKSDSAEKAFLNIPLLGIGRAVLIATFIIGTLAMTIPNLPNWIGALVCILILFFYAIAAIKASAAADTVADAGENVKAKTSTMRKLTADAEALLYKSDNEEIRAECRKVYEALRYSDPMSNEALEPIETRIAGKLLDFEIAIDTNDSEKVLSISNQLIGLIENRSLNSKFSK